MRTLAAGLTVAQLAPAATSRGPRDAALGLASAGVLYASFRAADGAARRLVPGADSDIQEIHAWRNAAGAPMGAPVVSHAAWDVDIFPVAPVGRRGPGPMQPAGAGACSGK